MLAAALLGALLGGRAPAGQVQAPSSAIETRILSDVDITVFLKNGTLCTMDLEDYIVGVVAGEMPASYQEEALCAQAVAARTYAVRKMQNGGCSRHEGADICAFSEHCQAYCTEQEMRDKWGDEYTACYEKIRRAVETTAGVVMTYAGEIVEALFFSSSGGRTEDCVNVFSSSVPYLVGVDSPEAQEVSTKTYTAEEFVALALAACPGCGLTAADVASQVSVAARYASGQVQTLRLGGGTITGKEARTAFSLRSANFSLACGAGEVVFTVLGYGHGVGMSQKGANTMAGEGGTWQEILSHYYTGVEFEGAAAVLARG